MYKYEISEAAAAVAANQRLYIHDMWEIVRFALSAMTVISMAVALI